jgi:HEAT repeat protein
MGLAKARPRASADLAEAPVDPTPPRCRLEDPDPAIRRRAVHALAAEPGNEARLCRHLPLESDRSVRETILLSLVRLGTDEAASGLARLLASEEAVLRNGALESLAAMPEAAARLLDQLRAAADHDVRIFAVILAGGLPFAWIGDWLTAMLAEEQDPNVCAALAEALAETGDHRAVRVLEAMRARFPDEPFLQFVAETVIRRLPREA